MAGRPGASKKRRLKRRVSPSSHVLTKKASRCAKNCSGGYAGGASGAKYMLALPYQLSHELIRTEAICTIMSLPSDTTRDGAAGLRPKPPTTASTAAAPRAAARRARRRGRRESDDGGSIMLATRGVVGAASQRVALWLNHSRETLRSGVELPPAR